MCYNAPMRNFQIETDKVLISVKGGEKPSLLLQSCCGPCSSYVLEYLTEHFDVTLLYYNPNIQPREEYDLRLFNQLKLLEAFPQAELLPCGYDSEAFDEAVRGLEAEPEGGARCTACFRLRLSYTARTAAEQGFDFFCTTLTVSPHKDANRINAMGRELGEKYGVRWLPSDFKKRDGYKRSIELSAQHGLYRQDYCGCLFSK
ncbi:MAG: epoxyqueuosine reductase QueH [Clostridia bacterium]|nr:epoxyqueuosine reductase QueH [Clostridia bacterium]